MKIHYEVKDSICITKCEYLPHKNIGSWTCSECEWCKQNNKDKKIVICKYPNNKKEDAVNPSHYKYFKKEVIETIKESLTDEEFKGYCKGNLIKYRLRAGIKGGIDKRKEDLKKSNWYQDKLNEVENERD